MTGSATTIDRSKEAEHTIAALHKQGLSVLKIAGQTRIAAHKVQREISGPQQYKRSPRDPDFAAIQRAYEGGKTLTNLWLDYRASVDKPPCYTRFLRRRTLWIAAGKPDPQKPIVLSGPKGAQAPTPLPIVVASGLAFIGEDGVALQVRKGALCIRSADGAERLFRPSEHIIKTLILAGAGGPVTVEAIRWVEAERVGLLIANRSGEGFSLFSTDATLNASKTATPLRRKQFMADPLKVAKHIVRLKIESMKLDQEAVREAMERLKRARIVYDAVSVEGMATRLYWARWRGFEIKFRDKVPEAWKTFQTRLPARFLKTARTAAVFSPRNATRPANAALSYAYQVTLSQLVRAIIALGLDPVYGFLHVDKRGRLSFGYDCLELLRVHIDTVVFDFMGGPPV